MFAKKLKTSLYKGGGDVEYQLESLVFVKVSSSLFNTLFTLEAILVVVTACFSIKQVVVSFF